MFKVGDRVVVIALTGSDNCEIGQTGTIMPDPKCPENCCDQNMCYVDFGAYSPEAMFLDQIVLKEIYDSPLYHMMKEEE